MTKHPRKGESGLGAPGKPGGRGLIANISKFPFFMPSAITLDNKCFNVSYLFLASCIPLETSQLIRVGKSESNLLHFSELSDW